MCIRDSLKAVVPPHPPLLLDNPQEVQQFLGAAHRKGGDDQVAPLVEGLLDNPGQFPHIVGGLSLAAVAVGGFHDHIIGLAYILGILDKGLI